MKGITDADYTKAKRVCKGFAIKNLSEDYDSSVQSDYIFIASCCI